MKKLMAIVIISLLTFTGLAISAERDCKNPKKTSEKLLCKISKLKTSKSDSAKGDKKQLFKTPKLIQKLNKWNSENKTLSDMMNK